MTEQTLLPLRQFISIVHHVPGRLRVRINRKALAFLPDLSLADLRSRIESIEGVLSLRTSPATASAVIEYDHHRTPPSLWTQVIEGSDDAAAAAVSALYRHPSTKER